MPSLPRPSLGALALAGGLLAACSAPAPAPEKVTPEAAPAEAAPVAEAKADTPPPLTAEELALIAADPKDLTPDQRRARAYARRKQIMQNPDSPTARALNDLAEAHQAGDIEVGRKDGVWFSAPGSKPTGGRPPAGYRPPEGSQAPPASTAPTPTPTPNTPAAGAPAGQP